ncbi:MAG TPA: DUF6463 family protein [Luteimonas sp.]|nr:DUF6463 family protein [Luteimonas sp.]
MSRRIDARAARRLWWAGTGMIALSVLHLVALGKDAIAYIAGWTGGRLWTLEHWNPPASMSPELLASNYAFWTTLGSFAAPAMALGCLLRQRARECRGIPAACTAIIVAWTVLATLIMQPAGFVLALIPAWLMLAATERPAKSPE